MIVRRTIDFIRRHACERPFSLWLAYFLVGSLVTIFLLVLVIKINAQNSNKIFKLSFCPVYGFLTFPATMLVCHSINYGIYRLSKGLKNSYWDVLRISILAAMPSIIYWFLMFSICFIMRIYNIPSNIIILLGLIGGFLVHGFCFVLFLMALKEIKGMYILRWIFLFILYLLIAALVEWIAAIMAGSI